MEIAYIIIGSFLTAVGVAIFTAPSKIVDGGASGIATICYHLFGWDIGLVTLAISLPLFVLGLKIFGQQYGLKSLLGTILLSLFISLLNKCLGYQGILDLSKDSSHLLASLFGGVITGFGIGLVLKSGSNTGGTDIIAQILSRYTFLSQGTALFLVDATVILASAFFLSLESALYGIITAYITTMVVNQVVVGIGTKSEKTVFIISEKPQGIEEAILNELGHGGTILTAYGMYSKIPKPVIMCVISNHELGQLTNFVHNIDPKAFMIVQEAYQVLGEGFTPIEEATWGDESDVTQQKETKKKITSPKVSQDNSH